MHTLSMLGVTSNNIVEYRAAIANSDIHLRQASLKALSAKLQNACEVPADYSFDQFITPHTD